MALRLWGDRTCHLEFSVVRMPYEMQKYPKAPFTARYRLEIFAPTDKVWDWLSRVDMWTTWRQDVSCAYWVNGKGRNGTLKWRLRGMLGFTAKVAVWNHERDMRWDAVSYGTRVSHVMRVDGDYRRTKVTLDVTGHGGLLRFYPTRALFIHQVNRSNEIWLGALKTKLEFGKDDLRSSPRSNSPFVTNGKLPSEITHFDR